VDVDDATDTGGEVTAIRYTRQTQGYGSAGDLGPAATFDIALRPAWHPRLPELCRVACRVACRVGPAT